MNVKLLTLTLAICGIMVLYGLSLLTHPTAIELNKISEYEGKEIITSGIVQEHHQTSYGTQFITIKENISQATIYLEEPITVYSGDIIQATGTVQKYENSWEIIVDHPRKISILSHWNATQTPLWEIAQYPERFIDTNLNISGYIDSTFSNQCYISDTNGTHTLLVTYPTSKTIQIHHGEPVIIHGFFTYNKTFLRYQIELSKDYHTITPINEEF